MVDPKAVTESGHDNHQSHIKQNVPVDDNSHTPLSSDVGVSVIVKSVHNIDSSERAEKESHSPIGNGLQNEFLTASSLDSHGKDGAKSSKGDIPASEVTFKDAAFNQFSTISSAEEFEDEKKEVDDPPDKEEVQIQIQCAYWFNSPADFNKLKALGRENISKTGVSTSGYMDKNKVKREAESNSITLSVYETFKVRKAEDKLKGNSEKMLKNRFLDGKPSSEKKDSSIVAATSSKTKPSYKLSL